MEEIKLSWLDKWYLSNDSITANTKFDIRIHHADGRKTDIKGNGFDDIILYIFNKTEKKQVIWITQYPHSDTVSIGIQK